MGTRLFTLAGPTTKVDFVEVYGPKGPKMTWIQRAKAGVDAKHFQKALKVKSGGGRGGEKTCVRARLHHQASSARSDGVHSCDYCSGV
jgi:hypothetical protein